MASQTDIDKIISKTKEVDEKELGSIYSKYSRCLSKLINSVLESTKKYGDESDVADIESIKRIVNLVPIEEKLIRTKDSIWETKEYILNKNAEYFMNRNYDDLVNTVNQQDIMNNIIEIVKNNYEKSSNEEKEYYWKRSAELLKYVIQFKILIGDLK